MCVLSRASVTPQGGHLIWHLQPPVEETKPEELRSCLRLPVALALGGVAGLSSRALLYSEKAPNCGQDEKAQFIQGSTS